MKWLARTRDGREATLEARLWYDAREIAVRALGASRDDVHVELIEDLVEKPIEWDKRVSVMDFMLAPDFTVFVGPALDCGIGDGWDVFGIDGGAVPDKEVEREAIRRGIIVAYNGDGMWCTPEWDSDALDADHPAACDECAALAYLNNGGRLVKLPDHMGSRYYRLYPVLHIQSAHKE